MADTPSLDDALKQALAGLDNDDVRIFYAYFDELQQHARRYLGRKAQVMPGASSVAESALVSLFCDLAVQHIPLADVDEHGYPMLWPLLLKYIERHCDKWNHYFQAKKRQGAEVPLTASADDGGRGFDPADYRAPADEEQRIASALEQLNGRLRAEDRALIEGRLQGETLEELAARIGRSQSHVSNRLKQIRTVLETA